MKRGPERGVTAAWLTAALLVAGALVRAVT
jgi:hypothetical protein